MTLDEWNGLRAGALIADRYCSDSIRKVFGVNRVKGQRGQAPGVARVALTVSNLRGGRSTTVIFCSDEIGMRRFAVARKADGSALTSADMKAEEEIAELETRLRLLRDASRSSEPLEEAAPSTRIDAATGARVHELTAQGHILSAITKLERRRGVLLARPT